MKWGKITVIVILVAILPSFVVSKTFGQTSSSINASIKISVCGNGIIEGGEDCEGANLNNKTCQSLGYSGGTLSCDISCSFDTSQCIPPTPTPTLLPTATPTSTPIPTAAPTATPGPPQANTQTITSTIAVPTQEQPTATPETINLFNTTTSKITQSNVPQNLQQLFDINKDGTINFSDLRKRLYVWIDAWKKSESTTETANSSTFKTCDLNNDGVCDLQDFSYIMYFSKK